MKKVLCVIPSRIGSTRLPRKALLPIQGKPMVQWVYENAARCSLLTEVVVATDSEEIAAIITACKGKVILTDPTLPTGSDRVAAVAAAYPEMDIVINLQGDEPFIRPKMLEQLIQPYIKNESPDMTTLAYPITSESEFTDPGIVKVITDMHHNALYFSRASIPFKRNPSINIPVYHHIGLYAFRRDFLLHYTTLTQTPLEYVEALEQLRALENGYRIQVCLTEHKTLEINTAEELAQAQHFNYEAELG
jgi:3-deoxy-manno-octulosonate cytidylyltransferase (CMP-KDO synthetase)